MNERYIGQDLKKIENLIEKYLAFENIEDINKVKMKNLNIIRKNNNSFFLIDDITFIIKDKIEMSSHKNPYIDKDEVIKIQMLSKILNKKEIKDILTKNE